MLDRLKVEHVSRRKVLAGTARAVAFGVGCAVMGGSFLGGSPVLAASPGGVQPEETIDDTIARLFGGREIKDGAEVLELKMPMIAENGAVVQARVEAKGPMAASGQVKNIYILVDKNRRPMSARYSFTPEAGGALIATNLRLGATTKVRAVAEMADGSLYQATQDVRVTVGGCGG